jgi:hypothetical protein
MRRSDFCRRPELSFGKKEEWGTLNRERLQNGRYRCTEKHDTALLALSVYQEVDDDSFSCGTGCHIVLSSI